MDSTLLRSMAAASDDWQFSMPIRPKLNGEPIDLWLHQMTWSDMDVQDDGNVINMYDRDRAYISTSEEADAFAYFRPNMLGGYVSYDVDISNMPCGCITAIYQVFMPARFEDGSLSERHGWYCGAQQSKYGGVSCPEFDVMEANQWGFHTTAHACEPPNEFGHWHDTACDFKGQCVIDIEDVGAVDRYGPGEEFDINTLKKFNVRLDYHEFEGSFVGYTTTMTQGDQQIVLRGDCRDYLNRMSDVFNDGMSWVVSSWNPPSAKWLQGDRCDEECVWPVSTVFENLEFWTYGGEEAKDVDIVWGRSCSSLRDGLCGPDCTECRFSYPADELDMWWSDWARCRCKDTTVYSYGSPCPDCLDLSKCGKDCEFCNMSWEPNDPDKWHSPNMQCRCVPKQPKDITFGQKLAANQADGICGDSCTDCRWSWPSDDPDKWKSVHAMFRCATDYDQ